MTRGSCREGWMFWITVSNFIWGVLFLKKIGISSKPSLLGAGGMLILNKMPFCFWIAYSYYLPNLNMGYQKSELKVENSSQDQSRSMPIDVI